jgi:hypothetical protein
MKNAILSLLLSAWAAFGAIYHVDFATGLDSNDGLSTSTPFKRAPGDAQATGTAASTTLAAGDTVIFKGGVRYSGEVSLDWSGTVGGGYITYDGNSDGTWGTGRAIMDGNITNLIAFDASSTARYYIRIQNFDITRYGGYETNDAIWADTTCASPVGADVGVRGIGVAFEVGGSNIVVQSCDMWAMGAWQNQSPLTGNAIDGFGVRFVNCLNTVTTNCSFRQMKNGIRIEAGGSSISSNNWITKCTFTNQLVWGVDLSIGGANATMAYSIITNSFIGNMTEYDLGNWAGCPSPPHTDGIFARNSGQTTATWVGNRIEACDFKTQIYNNTEGGTAAIFISEGPSIDIFNCVFMGARWLVAGPIEVGQQTLGALQEVRIFNNSFLEWGSCVTLATETDEAVKKVYVMNNIFYLQKLDTGGYLMDNATGTAAPVASDYNLFYRTNSASTARVALWDGVLMTLEALQTNSLALNNSNSIYGDPGYLVSSYVVTNSTGYLNDLRITTNSPAYRAGTNVSAFITSDRNGNPRIAATPSIGAFEPEAESGGSSRAFSSQIGGRGVTFGGRVELR